MAFRPTVARLAAQSSGLWGTLEAWAVKTSGFAKYGLRREDLINEDLENVQEALARLPAKEIEDRHYRFKRALNLSLQYKYLPADQQTKPEEDIRYLTPVMRQVDKEIAEKKKFNSME